MTLAPIAEDSGARLITQAQLLTNASDADGPSLTATGLAIASGSGNLVDNGNGTWTYTPALNDETAVSFTYSVTDGTLSVVGSASLDITPVNDAPSLALNPQSTLLNTPLFFNASNGNQIVLVDVDAGSALIQVSLNTTNGSFSLASLTGLSFTTGDGTADTAMVFTGSLSNINTAFNNAFFTPTNGFSGSANLTLNINDLGNTGAGGALITNQSTLIQVAQINFTSTTTNPFIVNQTLTGYQSAAITQTLDDGRVLYAWINDALSDNNTSMTLFGRILNADSTPATNEFQIGTWAVDGTDNYDVHSVNLVKLTNGNVVVGWVRNAASPGGDEPVFSIINPNFAPTNPSFFVVTQAEAQQNDTTTFESAPVLTALADGRFMATWITNGLDEDKNVNNVVSRIFNADGSAATGDFQVGSVAVDGFDNYGLPNLTVKQLTGGNVVIGFVRSTAFGADTPVFHIINPSLTPGSPGFTIISDVLVVQNDVTTFETPPVIQALSDGRFISVWVRNGVDDASSTTVWGRIFNANGTAASNDFQIGTLPSEGWDELDNDRISLAELNNGRVIIAIAKDNGVTDGRIDPYLTIIDTSRTPGSAGFVVASDVRVNGQITPSSIFVGAPIVVAMPGNTGNFAIAWPDSSADGALRVRLFNSAGVALTNEINVSTGAANFVSSLNGFDVNNIQLSAINNKSIVLSWAGANDGNLTGAFTSIVNFNATPLANNSTVSTNEDTTYTFTAADFNFSDFDGDTLNSIKITSLAAVGSLQLNGVNVTLNQVISRSNINAGLLRFIPQPNANGINYDSFGFTVSDGVNESISSYVMTINVSSVNDAPTTTPVTLAPITEDSGARLITQAQLLANATDVDGPSLTATGLAIASGSGSLVDNGNGTWTYTPALNDDTAVSFTYSVTDGSLIEIGSASLDITPVNDAPDVNSIGAITSISEDTFNSSGDLVSALFTSTDADSGALTGIAVFEANNTNGQWQYALDGTTWVNINTVSVSNALLLAADATTRIRFVPNADFNGVVFPLSLRAWDQTIGTAGGFADTSITGGATAFSVNGGSVSITVTPVNDAPVFIGLDNTPTFIEGASPVVLDANVSIFDRELSNANNFAGTTLFLSRNGAANAQDIFGATGTLTTLTESGAIIVGGTTVGTVLQNSAGLLALSFNASATSTLFNQVIQQVTYANTSDTPPASVNIRWIFNDGNSGAQGSGGSLAASGNITVSIIATNDAPSGTNNTITTLEDTAYTFTVADFGFSDVEGHNLDRIFFSTVPSQGTLLWNGNIVNANDFVVAGDIASGLLTYVPALDSNGTGLTSFTFQVQDDGGTANGGVNLDPSANTMTINVTPVNDAPTTAPVTLAAIAEDSGARLITQAELLANAADVDGPSLTATTLAIASGNGNLVDNVNGTWTYTPALNDDTAVSFSYTVSDGTLSVAGSASLDMTPVNDAPLFIGLDNNPTYTEDGAPVVLDNNVIFSDIEIAAGLDTYQNIDLFLTRNGGANPDDIFSATGNLSALIEGGNVILSGSTIGLIVSNSAGVLNIRFDLSATASQVNEVLQSIAYSNTSNTPTANVQIDWNMEDSNNGLQGSGGNLFATGFTIVNIVSTNDVPALTGAQATLANGAEDTAYTVTLSDLLQGYTDAEGDTLNIASLNASNGSIVDNGNGTFTITPTANFNGLANLTYNVIDGNGGITAATQSYTLDPVNDAPTNAPVTLATIAEDSGARLITQAELLANATDVDGPSLTATTLAIASGNGSLVDNGNGTWTYTPALNDDTAVSFSYTVSDGTLSVAGSASLDITPVNDAPTANNLSINAVEDVVLNSNLPIASDVEGNVVTYSLASAASNGAVVVNADGSFSYAPALNFNGTDSFTYTVDDGNGGTNTYTVTVSVAAINDAPTVANAIPNQTAAEDSAFSFTFAANTFADVDVTDTLTYSAQLAGGGALPSWLSFDAVTRTLSGTPANGDVGTFSIDIIADDGNGGVVTDTFSITVVNVNDAPTVANTIPNQTATEDSAFSFTFAANTFADVDVTDTLTYSAQLAGGGALPSWLSFDAVTRTLSGTPANGDVGSFSIDIIADDGNGGVVTDTFSITVVNVNDTPTLTGAQATLANGAEDTAYTVTLSDLLQGYTDAEGDTLNIASLNASNGSIVDNGNGTFTITPTANFNGLVNLSYNVIDGNGGITAATQSYTLDPVNDAPTANNLSINAVEDVVLNSNLPIASDVEGNVVTYSLASAASNGAVVVNADGSFSYAPALNFNGTDSFTYTVDDGNGGTNTYTVTVSVAAINDAPTVANAIPNQTAAEDSAFSFTFAANTFADVDVTDTLTYSAQLAGGGALPSWLSFDAVTRTLSGTPANGDVGSFSIDIIADDGNGGVVTDTFSITVVNVNDAPALTGAQASLANGAEDTAYTVTLSNLLQGYTDAEGDTLNIASLNASNGSIVDNGNGTFTITPTANFNGLVNLSYNVIDGNGGITAATQSYTLDPVNDAPTTALVTLATIAEDSGARLITQAELLANAADVDGPSLTATTLAIASGNGNLVDNGNGTWSYTPALNDDTAVSFSYTVTDGSLSVVNNAILNITSVNDTIDIPIDQIPGEGGNNGNNGNNNGNNGNGNEPPSPTNQTTTTVTQSTNTTPLVDLPLELPSQGAEESKDNTLASSNAVNVKAIQNKSNKNILLNNNLARVLNNASFSFQYAESLQLEALGSLKTNLNNIFVGINPLNGVQFDAIEFIEDTSTPTQEVIKFLAKNKVVISTAAVSAGLVTWAAQYTALFSSVLATLPAWKNLDPVAILGKDEDPVPQDWESDDDSNEEDDVDTVLSR